MPERQKKKKGDPNVIPHEGPSDTKDITERKRAKAVLNASEVRYHRLFEPFSQIKDKSTKEIGGTGLGLAITKRFVEAMGGKITLESGGVGKGTTIRFWLPKEVK